MGGNPEARALQGACSAENGLNQKGRREGALFVSIV
jgi:hypothetical protein